MPTPEQIVRHEDPLPGTNALVGDARPQTDISIVASDPAWPDLYTQLAERVRAALGWRVLALDHVGSTSVPGLPAKPIIDLDLVVADPAAEDAYVPALEAAGFELRVREPWWWEHRMLRGDDPSANLHVFGPEAPEPIRHRLFRDWLRGNPDDLVFYRDAKIVAAQAANSAGEDVMQYNARKEQAIREIYGRAFRAAGLLG